MLSFFGCEINQPDQFYDTSADIYPAFDLYVTGLQSNQHIAATKSVTLNFVSSTDSVKEVYVYLDDNLYTHMIGNHSTFYIYTSSLTLGKHVLKIYVVAANKGLYSAVNVSQLAYTIPFYYDTTPPPDVVVNQAVYKNGHPYLTWNKSTYPGFQSYMINYLNKYNTVISDTINDINKTWYTDTSTSLMYGKNIMSCKLSQM